jgi:S-adenosylmethionine hydrolase
MPPPVIALLTDFGTRDHYVGTMKGVIAGICPTAHVIDITHDVPAHDVLTGALELRAACRYFPRGTVFVAVIDPGVGSTRKGIAARAGSYLFVAPDNGVLGPAIDSLKEHGGVEIVELTAPQYALPSISRTFEGRDRFAPAAAWLASGVDLAVLGQPLPELQRIGVPAPHVGAHWVEGEILSVDRFGNLRSNICTATLAELKGDTPLIITIADHQIDGLIRTYSEVPPGTLCALVGSSGYLEIAVMGGSAASLVRVSRGTPVRVRRHA